jgi:hypothetical protein
MERRVTVNDGIERVELEILEELEAVERDDEAKLSDDQRIAAGHGPCLHLGHQGQRCSRQALAGGYCARHHSDPELRMPGRNYTRVIVATVALVAIVWPYVAEVVRDLIRWLASPQ